MLFIPMASPSRLMRGPPELPNVMAASVWIYSGTSLPWSPISPGGLALLLTTLNIESLKMPFLNLTSPQLLSYWRVRAVIQEQQPTPPAADPRCCQAASPAELAEGRCALSRGRTSCQRLQRSLEGRCRPGVSQGCLRGACSRPRERSWGSTRRTPRWSLTHCCG